MGSTWPAWTLALSSTLAPSGPFATLGPFPTAGLPPGPASFGALALGAASELEVIKEEVGTRQSVGKDLLSL